MSDRPILMSAPMVQAVLAGDKTQTRRLLYSLRKWPEKGSPTASILSWPARGGGLVALEPPTTPDPEFYYSLTSWAWTKPGDRLWVREAWRCPKEFDNTKPRVLSEHAPVRYEADGAARARFATWGRLRPGLHMPRWASRLTLHVTEVRVQKLQDISEEDALAEGVERVNDNDVFPIYRDYLALPKSGPGALENARRSYATMMDYLHGPGFWTSNPWIVAVSFDPELKNITEARI